MENKYELRAWGRSYNPSNWFCNPYYLINRIYYICGGSAYYRNSKKLQKGYVYIFPASSSFAVSQAPDDPVDHIYFDFFSYQKIKAEECTEIDLAALPSLRNILLAAEYDFQIGTTSRKIGQAYFSLITTLLQEFLPAQDRYRPLTRSAIQFIHESDVRYLTVNSVAEHVCVNVNHLIRCFRKDTNITPHRYIAMYKADMATSMISRGISITVVAEATGFSSLSAFSTFYKGECHISPSEVGILTN